MSRVYATEEGSDQRHLVALECDGCGARAKPAPDIAASGWTKRGVIDGAEKLVWYYCPNCPATRD